MPPLTLQIGERRFKTTEATLRESSSYFEALFSGSWKADKEEDGSFFIDRDGDIFAYILAFLRSGKYPFFYHDDDRGFDHDRYVGLGVESEYFGIDTLSMWIQHKTYEKVIELRRTGRFHDGLDEFDGVINADSKYQYFQDWETRKTYVCPRGLTKHRGQPQACGRQCHNARGDDEPEYEDEREVVVVELCTHKKFNKQYLTA